MFRDERIIRAGKAFQCGSALRVRRVPHCDRYVTQEPSIFRAEDRRAAEQIAELLCGKGGEAFQRRSERARGEAIIHRRRGLPAPGADILTDIAPEDVLADRAAVYWVNRTTPLERELG